MARIKPLRIRLSDDERAALDAEAERHHLPTATWARSVLLSRVSTVSRAPVHLTRNGSTLCGVPLAGNLRTEDASEATCPDCLFAAGRREG